jgi:hypothetical protein
VKNLYRNVKDLLRNIYIWKNDEFDWTSERICMAKIWKSEEFVWKREGFIKKSEEFLWKNDEFVWKSERIYMAQRYSKYRFFDVNCILSILFQVQLWGCPGKPKFQFHILCVRSRLYIHISILCMYIYVGVHHDVQDFSRCWIDKTLGQNLASPHPGRPRASFFRDHTTHISQAAKPSSTRKVRCSTRLNPVDWLHMFH